ncbi:prolyl oligopeptidase family serine peptidase, partial [Candidatus Aminicenantes bacterium AC-334-K16]|nr:prolyl oligopeptidase family serine peptidase [Candidatus Aminicenantes bacterium AC-334-K16]
VTEYMWTKDGSALIFAVASQKKPDSDGVYVFKTADQQLMPLVTGQGRYEKLALNKEETRLAFLTDRDDQASESPLFSIYGWDFLSSQAKLWVSAEKIKELFPGQAPSNKSRLIFSRNGQQLVFGTKEIPPVKKKEGEGEEEKEEKAKFDLWHWNDPYPQPQQKKMAEQVKNNTWECVYHLATGKIVKLADEILPDVELHESGEIAWGQTIVPYTKLVSYDGSYYDVYLVDPQTGTRTLVKKKLFRRAYLSPQGKYVFWFEKGDWYIYDRQNQKTVNVTANLGVSFAREDWDTPNPAASYGYAGWTTDDNEFLVYDQYDIWAIKPDGSSARRITEGFGRTNHLSFRYLKLDPEEKNIDPQKKLLLKVRDEETMAEGFYLDRVKGKEKPQKLLLVDKRFSSITKARKANRIIFARMSFDEYPDLWTADLRFRKPRKITDLGRQMEPFIWGKAELRNFSSADGKPLKGILIKPDNFDPKKKYPLLVYIYETLHYMLHIFRHPAPGTSINPAYYVSNGYILWMPDIEYGTGYPGRDALKCVLPGVNMLIQEGYINPRAIGIQGHSWGGYQVAYLVTQTDIFAAAEAGAPVSNMVSAYNGIRWGSGMVRQFQYEKTQSRLGDSLWRVPLRYIENSPIFWADKINTPLLIIHNDEDGAVPWYQGIEFIMALRRLGKVAFMFNYNGEAHGLRKRVNQKDWTQRMAEFFDHYLRGKPAPRWMTEGIKAWEKED